MKPIGEKIKCAREECGLSQYQLAKKIPVLSQSQLSKIETGNRGVSAEDLILISKALDVPVEKLLSYK